MKFFLLIFGFSFVLFPVASVDHVLLMSLFEPGIAADSLLLISTNTNDLILLHS